MLIDSHRYVGDLFFKLGDLEQASRHYDKQLAMNEEMVAADPANAQFLSNKAVALIKVGDIKARSKRTAEAHDYYQKAFDTLTTLSHSIPADAGIREMLEEAKQKRTRS
jgi:tetratricopeptide (TPR) repeat protein